MLLRRRPAPPLDRLVATLWASERPAMPHPRERNLPTGRADVVIALGQPYLMRFSDATNTVGQRVSAAVVQGPRDTPVFRDTSRPSNAVGVHFTPEGAMALLGLPMSEFVQHTVALEEVWGRTAVSLIEQLQAARDAPARLRCLESFLQRRLSRVRPHADDAAVAWALRQFDANPGDMAGPQRVDSVRQVLGWSPLRFIDQFALRAGLTPKRYLRVRRFQTLVQTLAAGRDDTWAHLAADGGYADQSHLIREFRAFSGLTPGRYRAVAPDQASHVAVPAPP